MPFCVCAPRSVYFVLGAKIIFKSYMDTFKIYAYFHNKLIKIENGSNKFYKFIGFSNYLFDSTTLLYIYSNFKIISFTYSYKFREFFVKNDSFHHSSGIVFEKISQII